MKQHLVAAVSLTLVAIGFASTATVAGRQPAGTAAPALSAETRQKLMTSLNRGAEYVRSQQKPDGTWESHPGITAMAAAALLRQTGVPRDKSLQTVGKTLDYLKTLAKQTAASTKK